jgi:phage FluMu protein Com
MNCTHCNNPLNESQTHGRLKSCPQCSSQNGHEHVFYPFPSAFGTSTKRITKNHPAGDQSYCYACRGGKDSPYSPILCSQKQE